MPARHIADESVFVLSSEENVVVFKIRRTTAALVTCMVHAVGRSVRYLITAQVWSIGRLSLIGSYHNLLPGKQTVSTLSFCLNIFSEGLT